MPFNYDLCGVMHLGSRETTVASGRREYPWNTATLFTFNFCLMSNVRCINYAVKLCSVRYCAFRPPSASGKAPVASGRREYALLTFTFRLMSNVHIYSKLVSRD